MQNSTRSQRMSPYVQKLLNDVGFYQYSGDPFGILRNNEKDTTKGWWHDTPARPATTLNNPPLRWFFRNTEDVGAGAFTPANVGSGTALALQDKRGGWAKSTNAAADNDYYYYFSLSEISKLVDGSNLLFLTKIIVDDVDQADLFIGLCKALASGNLFDNRVDCVGFTLADGAATLNYVTTKDSTGSPATTGASLTDATEVELAFRVTGVARVDFYVDNVWKAASTSNINDNEEMAFAFGLRNGQAVANGLSISTTSVLMW